MLQYWRLNQPGRQAGDRSETVPKAIHWLTLTRGQAVREALDEGFFGGLDEAEYQALMGMEPDTVEAIMPQWVVGAFGRTTINQKKQPA